MPIKTPLGVLYTEAGCRAWMAAAGFRETSGEHFAGRDWMVVEFK